MAAVAVTSFVIENQLHTVAGVISRPEDRSALPATLLRSTPSASTATIASPGNLLSICPSIAVVRSSFRFEGPLMVQPSSDATAATMVMSPIAAHTAPKMYPSRTFCGAPIRRPRRCMATRVKTIRPPK